MAKTPEQDSVFLREVDEAVRAEQFDTFFRKYGTLVIAVVVLILGGFGGWLWYQNNQAEQSGQKGEILVQALDRVANGSPEVAAEALDELKASDSGAYRAAARFAQATVATNSGDKAGAVALLGEIADDSDVPQDYRDLALLRKTEIEYDALEPDVIIERLKSLVDSESPWFGTASELTAIAHMNKGERSVAGQIYADIAAREDIEPSLQRRAVQMAGMLGVDAVTDTDADTSTAPAEAATSGQQPTG